MIKQCTLFFVHLLLFASIAKAQNNENIDSLSRYQRLDVSFVFGGQIYNNNLIYNPGYGFQNSYGLKLNESVGIGIGFGYYGLQKECFLPVFVETIGYKKKMPSSPFIKMQAGYAFGWYKDLIQIEGHSLSGGVYIDAGMGRKIMVNRTYSILFQCSYRHQFGHMEYEVFDQSYSESINYDLIVISIGIIRECL